MNSISRFQISLAVFLIALAISTIFSRANSTSAHSSELSPVGDLQMDNVNSAPGHGGGKRTILGKWNWFSAMSFEDDNVAFIGQSDVEAREVVVKDDYAYVVSDYTLAAVDVSDPKEPSLTSEVTHYGPMDVAVSGNYAYVANGEYPGLDIVNISDPNDLIIVSYTDTDSGGAHSVAVERNYAYLIESDYAGQVNEWYHQLTVIDTTDRADPTIMSKTVTRKTFHEVEVADGYAYVGESGVDHSLEGGGLRVFDVSDPAKPVEASFLNLNTPIFDIDINGSFAYLAGHDEGLYIVDISDPTNPKRVGPAYWNGWSASGVAADNNYAYLTDKSKGLHVIDISEPTSPNEVGSYNLEEYTQSVGVDDEYIYVADGIGGLVILQYTGDTSIPVFVYPSEGASLDFASDYKFKVQPVDNVEGFLWGFFQNGHLVWENLRDEGLLSSNEYTIIAGTEAHNLFEVGEVEVWVRTYKQGKWSDPAIRTIYLISTDDNEADLAVRNYLGIGDDRGPFSPNKATIEARIENHSNSNSANDVVVEFFDGNPKNDGKLIGEEIIETLEPGSEKLVSSDWKLDGNVDSHQIYVQVKSLSTSDPNTENNSVSQPFSAYYVDFQPNVDWYEFYQSEIGSVSFSEIDNFLADIDVPKPFRSPIFGLFGILTELNGYCYGVSNSSTAYFMYPNLKPVAGKPVYDLTVEESRAKVRTYQWNVFIGFLEVLLGTGSYEAPLQFDQTVTSLRKGEPIIHGFISRTGFFPEKGAHAVVAYKTVKLGDERRVFYYDGNAPLKELENPQWAVDGVPYGTFSNMGFSYSPQIYQPYNYNQAHALPVQLSLPDSARQSVVEIAKRLALWMFDQALMSVTFAGEGELVVIDSDNNRTAFNAGESINTVPGSIVSDVDGMKTVFLPTSKDYRFEFVIDAKQLSQVNELAGTEPAFSLYVFDPLSERSIQSIRFDNISLSLDNNAFMQYSHGLDNPQIEFSDGTVQPPDYIELLDVDPFSVVYLPVIADLEN